MEKYQGNLKELWEYKAIKDALNKTYDGIFDDMSLCAQIPLEEAKSCIKVLLTYMNASNVLLIMLSSTKLWEVPQNWLTQNLGDILLNIDQSEFNINDDYDYCRIYDAVSHIPNLLTIVIEIGLIQKNPEVINFAKEGKDDDLPNGNYRFYNYTINHFQYLGLL